MPVPWTETKPEEGKGSAPIVPAPDGKPEHVPKDMIDKTGRALQKIANSYIENMGSPEVAGKAIQKFVEKEAKTPGESIKANEKRLREGKVIDAFWHFSTDIMAGTEDHAADMANESKLVQSAIMMAATIYGGPYAAAAVAAWLKYKQTNGNVEAAFLAGAIAGFRAYAMQGLDKRMPANEDILFQKAIIAGIMGGVATAAGGGDENDIAESFAGSAGGVLVVDGYQVETGRPLGEDAKRAVFDSFVMNGLERPVSPPPSSEDVGKSQPASSTAQTPCNRRR